MPTRPSVHVRFEAGGLRSDLDLQPGTWTVGGGTDDGVRFPGLLPRLLELDLSEDRVWLRCTAPCPVGRAVLAPDLRRWLLPGERVRLSAQACLWVEAAVEVPATVALVRSLLAPGRAALSVGPLLACVAGRDAGRVFPLLGPVTEVGRLPGCAVQLGDGAVSRRHLQLVGEGGAHRVRDVGGRNRARCNGRWLRARRGVLLTDGDLLEVGRSLLHYRAPDAEPPLTASETAPPAPPGAPSDGGAG
ncbi:MAG: FHA domain-containing protein [Myxococcaceae bacterium]